MTQRKNFIDYMSGKPAERIPVMEIGPWEQTTERWLLEGMPPHADASHMLVEGNDYFGLDGIDVIAVDLLPPYPKKSEEVIEETERYVLFSDEFGRKRKALKEGSVNGFRLSMDHYLEWPVKTYEDFTAYRKGYGEDTIDDRYPDDWEEIARRSKTSERPVSLLDPMEGTFGFYSMLRNFIGTENLSYLFYDEPNLIHEAVEMLLDYAKKAFGRVLRTAELDYYILHEDMCYKSGPLVSPAMFRDYFLAAYREFIQYLKEGGVKHVMMDTDGNFSQLLDLYLDAGIDSISPCECAAGMDVVSLRGQYPSLGLMGGIDKREIAKGKKEIEAEVKYKIGSIIDKGRYIPTIDHSIPPDIPLENFLYYLKLKKQYLNGK